MSESAAESRQVKKKVYREQELNLGLDAAKATGARGDLLVVAAEGAVLSPAQVQFNKLMKQLEKAQKKHQREQNRLDGMVADYTREVMPVEGEMHRTNFQMVVQAVDALKTMKFTPRRRQALSDLLRNKAGELVVNSFGLTEEEVERMRGVVEELTTEETIQEDREAVENEFEFVRGHLEEMARAAGIEIDLSDIDVHGDPAEIEAVLQQRFAKAMADLQSAPPPRKKGARKPTKAQIERERKQKEAEELKKRDLKSLYKQLAKVLHPDLETDPERKLQKEEWMKRLTTAHASGDLRELLSIEMEWLGVEASNLASATEEKLQVYCTVLKEQIQDMKFQTLSLIERPPYRVLERFMTFLGHVARPADVKRALEEELARFKEMLHLLSKGDAQRRKILNRWADDHANTMDEDDMDLW